MRVERSLLVCFVARSGSWFLCGLLASTGVLGTPDEFFWPPGELEARARHGFRSDKEYLDWVLHRGTTANGTFACKFQLGELRGVLRRLRDAVAGHGLSDRELLTRAFPHPCYVWLDREDRLAQAVSWARALQTNQWRSSDRGSGAASFNAEQIKGLADLIGQETAAWARWFDEQEIEPHRVTYEELLANRNGAVAAIADFAGIQLPGGTDVRPYPGFERQADELNDQWKRLYVELRGDGLGA